MSKDEVLWNLRELIAGGNALPYAVTEENVPVFAGDIDNPFYED